MAKAARDLKESGILSEADFNEERNSVQLKVRGLPSARLERQLPYVDVLEGELDAEKFATGDYVLWEEMEGAKKSTIHAGDSLELTVYDGEKDSCSRRLSRYSPWSAIQICMEQGISATAI